MMHTKRFAAARHSGLAFSLLLAFAGCAGSSGSTADAPCTDCGPAVRPPSPEGPDLTDVPVLDVALSDDTEQPSLSAALTDATIRVRRGAETTLEVRVDRRAFEGEVAVWAEGLPSGLVAEPTVMPGAVPTARLVIGATASVPLGGPHAFTVVVSATGVEPVEVLARVVVAGEPGTLDETFGDDGIAAFEGSVAVNAVSVDGHGRVLLAGRDWDERAMFIERLDSGGTVDAPYGQAARTVLPGGLSTGAHEMVMVGDRAYLLMGASEEDGRTLTALVVLDESGRPDPRFGGSGAIALSIHEADADGSYALTEGDGTVFAHVGERLVAVRASGEAAEIALPADLRMSWGMAHANHTLTLGVNDTVGSAPVMLERIHTAGGRDVRFGHAGVMRGMAPTRAELGESVTFAVRLLPDGGGFAGANRRFPSTTIGELVRFTADGQLDATFGERGRVTLGTEGERMLGLLLDGEGRPLAFTEQRPTYDKKLQRFTAAGERDRSFGEGGAVDLRALGINGVRRVARDAVADRVVACGQVADGWGCARFWL